MYILCTNVNDVSWAILIHRVLDVSQASFISLDLGFSLFQLFSGNPTFQLSPNIEKTLLQHIYKSVSFLRYDY